MLAPHGYMTRFVMAFCFAAQQIDVLAYSPILYNARFVVRLYCRRL